MVFKLEIGDFQEDSTDEEEGEIDKTDPAIELNGNKDEVAGEKSGRTAEVSDNKEAETSGGNGKLTIDDLKPSSNSKNDSVKLKCEVQEFEARYGLKGDRIVKEKNGKKVDADSDTSEYAVRSYTYYTQQNKVDEMRLEIFCPHIQEALREVIKEYPSQTFSGDIISLSGWSEPEALACIYHYRTDIEAYAAKEKRSLEARLNIRMLLKYVDLVLRRALRRYESHMRLAEEPCIEFQDLWMIYKPGNLVYRHGQGQEKALLKVFRIWLCNYCQPPYWVITTRVFGHDGKTFGYHHQKVQVDQYEGTKPIKRLLLQPSQYKEDLEEFKQQMIERGKRYCSLIGVRYVAYKGKGWAVDYERVPTQYGSMKDDYPQEAIQIDSRIMLDCEAFVEARSNTDIHLNTIKQLEYNEIKDADFMITHYKMPGFSMSEKRWCWFHVDNIREIEFDDTAFDALILPTAQKRLVRALTRQHTTEGAVQNDFDDFIKSKGRGCIFLFHGEPGVGKTFTVESIADSIKRPLYVMMSGDLGSNIEAIEKNLVKVLKLVTRWKAILLIDEADVFLEARSSHDLARNGLVSIWLRILEYFQGIMFLTTNRVASFDLAFQSRIHLAIKYPPLNVEQRIELWRMFLQRSANYDAAKWPRELLREFAELSLNGRQVKNAVRTANALALSEGTELSAEEIRVVLETVKSFTEDLNASNDTEGRGDKRGLPARRASRDDDLGMSQFGVRFS